MNNYQLSGTFHLKTIKINRKRIVIKKIALGEKIHPIVESLSNPVALPLYPKLLIGERMLKYHFGISVLCQQDNIYNIGPR
jgi:hypothetical protein